MVRACAARETPVVLLNRYVPGLEIHAVSCDNVAGGRQVAEFSRPPGSRSARLCCRAAGCHDQSRPQARVPVRSRRAGNPVVAAGGRRGATATRPASPPPSGLPPGMNVRTPSSLRATSWPSAEWKLCARPGCAFRTTFRVVGFDDVPVAAWPSHGLTTVRQPVKDMVGRCNRHGGLGSVWGQPRRRRA